MYYRTFLLKNLFCFVCSYIAARKRNMESKVHYTGIPPSNAAPALPPYATTDPATGQAPYGQPLGGYPPQPGYGAPQYVASQSLQAQQPQVVLVPAGPQQHSTNPQQVSSYIGHIFFACFVFWCCSWLFGLTAFILAS